MNTNKKRHILPIIIPILCGILYIALSIPRLKNSIYYGMSSTFPVILPILAICIFIVLLFHLLKHFLGPKIATILSLIFALAFGLVNILTAPDGHLSEILETLYFAHGTSETVVITDQDLNRELQAYPSPKIPILTSYPDNADHFWLIQPLPDNPPSSPLEGYSITDEISTPYHLAIKLQKI